MRNHCGNYHDHDDDDAHNDDNCYCFDCYDDFIVIMLIMMLIMMMIVMVFLWESRERETTVETITSDHHGSEI